MCGFKVGAEKSTLYHTCREQLCQRQTRPQSGLSVQREREIESKRESGEKERKRETYTADKRERKNSNETLQQGGHAEPNKTEAQS